MSTVLDEGLTEIAEGVIVRPAVDLGEGRYATVADDGCWLWGGYIDPDGYGRFGQNRPAHRWTYERFVAPIQPGLHIDHLCRNRACVNPYHLEAVTPYENNRRSLSPSGLNGRKTHCKRGHEFTPENTGYSRGPRGVMRRCKICASAATKRYRAQKRAAS